MIQSIHTYIDQFCAYSGVMLGYNKQIWGP